MQPPNNDFRDRCPQDSIVAARPRLTTTIRRLLSTTATSNNDSDNGTKKSSTMAPSSSAFRLYDSLSQEILPLMDSRPDEMQETVGSNDKSDTMKVPPGATTKKKGLAWYTCGPTTYAPAHMGHARTYVWIDIIRRVLEYDGGKSHEGGPSPLFVMNITDIDDKILNAAAENNTDPIELSRQMEFEFWNDLDALNCLRPHIVTRVTEYVDSDIIPYIEQLLDLGMAYSIENDGIYFDVRAYNDRLGNLTKYGKLAPSSAAEEINITTPPNDEGDQKSLKKRDPRDFVLWKLRKRNEPIYWSSLTLGDGRPGWHIECSAMIEAVSRQFQDTHEFQVHAGGIDLKFPHHSNEIAQSEAYHQNGEWIQHWLHTGHLHIEGQKMSKSLKNFITIQDYLTEFSSSESNLESPADDFRLWCLGLSGKYRGPATYSKTRIIEARSIREKIVRFLLDCDNRTIQIQHKQQQSPKVWSDEDHVLYAASQNTKQICMEALRDDLDGSKFVDEIVSFAEFGVAYLEKVDSDDKGGPPEELLLAVSSSIRSLLSLVGFSNKTAQSLLINGNDKHSQEQSNVVGGERAVIDSFAKFRYLVRQSALDDMIAKKNNKSNGDVDVSKKILQLCDEYRDTILPMIGIEIKDKSGDSSSWRYCLPKHSSSDTSESLALPSTENKDGTDSPAVAGELELHAIPIKDLFRVGQYEGMFSDFSNDGIPILNADGSNVSKRLLKKLLKKRDEHRKRLERHGAPKD